MYLSSIPAAEVTGVSNEGFYLLLSAIRGERKNKTVRVDFLNGDILADPNGLYNSTVIGIMVKGQDFYQLDSTLPFVVAFVGGEMGSQKLCPMKHDRINFFDLLSLLNRKSMVYV